MTRKLKYDVKKKNRWKVAKSVIQWLVLLVTGYSLFHVVVDAGRYAEPDRSTWTNRDGFIALSYFGVDRKGSSKLIPKDQLDEQFKVLHDLGFETISQQDILDFYKSGRPLPERALFLSFEDGRIDSGLYGQQLLEKYNFKATFLSYANKMGNGENKFVQPNDLLKMQKTGYWELGTNGYRLTYINIFDENGKHLGVIDESDISDKSHFEYYNHYLMDYIRDEHMVPVETRDEMAERIREDYRLMEQVYSKTLGFVPPVYMIMHANALYNGMNERVEQVNDEQIRSLFQIHFNREGHVYNSKDDNIYNLTRLQPAPYWSTNHLLMKIRQDTGWDLPFVTGVEEMSDQWNVISGAAEFKDHSIIVTSPPSKEGMIYLPAFEGLTDLRWTGKLSGNVIGRQSIYLRYDRDKNSYLRIMLENNRLHVDRKLPGKPEERVFSQKLSEIHWDGREVAFDKASVYPLEYVILGRLEEPDYPINIRHTRNFEITVQNDKLRVVVDNTVLLEDLEMSDVPAGGGIALAAERNEQNKKDDIYDAIFQNVTIRNLQPGAEETGSIIFSSNHTGIVEWIHRGKSFVSAIIDWAVETF